MTSMFLLMPFLSMSFDFRASYFGMEAIPRC